MPAKKICKEGSDKQKAGIKTPNSTQGSYSSSMGDHFHKNSTEVSTDKSTRESEGVSSPNTGSSPSRNSQDSINIVSYTSSIPSPSLISEDDQ